MAENIAEKLNNYIADSKPTLVEFYRPGCAGCVDMVPVVEQLKEKQAGKANVIAVDGYANPELREKYHINSYPTWIIFRDGQEAWRDGGRKSLGELTDMCHRFE